MARDVLGNTRCIVLVGVVRLEEKIDALPNAGARDGNRRISVRKGRTAFKRHGEPRSGERYSVGRHTCEPGTGHHGKQGRSGA
jgi:hypothetical protein